MFGLNDNNQQSNDDPAMLDNVKQLASEPASQVEPQQASPTTFSPTTVTPTAGTNTTNDSSTQTTTDNSVTTSTTDDTSATETTENTTPHAEPAEGFSSQPMPATPQPSETPADTTTPATGKTPAELFGNQQSNATEASSSEQPAIKSTSTPAEPSNTNEPAQNDVTAPPAPVADDTPASTVTTPTSDINHDHLASMKQEALGHLEGLTDHIDGEPEEVFKTTMQLIQANDNHALLEKALKAAKEIKDDKVRAQAMLDIVNEINYFSAQ